MIFYMNILERIFRKLGILKDTWQEGVALGCVWVGSWALLIWYLVGNACESLQAC